MATRTPLIAGNWKMNLTHLEGIALVQKISFTLPEKYLKHVEVAVFPPFTALRSVQTLIEADKIDFKYGAQDVSAHDSGAYTGDISGIQLAKLGCTYVLVGHSERREYHQESDELLAKKVAAAYKHGLIPMLCIGEGLEVREAGNQVEHSVNQVLAGLSQMEEVFVNGDMEHRVPHNLNISFAYVEGESLIMAIKDVAVSSGSACTSASLEPSYVLRALGRNDELAHSSIRFTLGRFTTVEEIDYTIDLLQNKIGKLRELSPLWDMYKEGIDLNTVQWAAH